ncbi:MAG: hypothetical protein IPI35_15225 [Deltaproteobacteria bacterium]|nr:hypothetical protein [Deltaproteobacteria bacterium]
MLIQDGTLRWSGKTHDLGGAVHAVSRGDIDGDGTEGGRSSPRARPGDGATPRPG